MHVKQIDCWRFRQEEGNKQDARSPILVCDLQQVPNIGLSKMNSIAAEENITRHIVMLFLGQHTIFRHSRAASAATKEIHHQDRSHGKENEELQDHGKRLAEASGHICIEFLVQQSEFW